MGAGDEPRSSCLYNKHPTNRAISQSPEHLFDTTHLVITVPGSQQGKQLLKEIICHFLSSRRSDYTKTIPTREGKKKRSVEFGATLF